MPAEIVYPSSHGSTTVFITERPPNYWRSLRIFNLESSFGLKDILRAENTWSKRIPYQLVYGKREIRTAMNTFLEYSSRCFNQSHSRPGDLLWFRICNSVKVNVDRDIWFQSRHSNPSASRPGHPILRSPISGSSCFSSVNVRREYDSRSRLRHRSQGFAARSQLGVPLKRLVIEGCTEFQLLLRANSEGWWSRSRW